ncbi:MAG: hypothetical protein R3A47_11235 [Polyangiales bacterium]
MIFRTRALIVILGAALVVTGCKRDQDASSGDAKATAKETYGLTADQAEQPIVKINDKVITVEKIRRTPRNDVTLPSRAFHQRTSWRIPRELHRF